MTEPVVKHIPLSSVHAEYIIGAIDLVVKQNGLGSAFLGLTIAQKLQEAFADTAAPTPAAKTSKVPKASPTKRKPKAKK